MQNGFITTGLLVLTALICAPLCTLKAMSMGQPHENEVVSYENEKKRKVINEPPLDHHMKQFYAIQKAIIAIENDNNWQAIALLNSVFDFTSNRELKLTAAKHLGIAYEKVHEPNLAYYFFNFVRNQKINTYTKKLVEQKIAGLQSFEELRDVMPTRQVFAPDAFKVFTDPETQERRRPVVEPECQIQ